MRNNAPGRTPGSPMKVIDELAQLKEHLHHGPLPPRQERGARLVEEAELGVLPGSGEGVDFERRQAGLVSLRVREGSGKRGRRACSKLPGAAGAKGRAASNSGRMHSLIHPPSESSPGALLYLVGVRKGHRLGEEVLQLLGARGARGQLAQCSRAGAELGCEVGQLGGL